jgi:hypothetical protein
VQEAIDKPIFAYIIEKEDKYAILARISCEEREWMRIIKEQKKRVSVTGDPL